MTRIRTLLVAASCLLVCSEAGAFDCDVPYSTCIDSSDLNSPVGPGRFASIESAIPLSPGALSFGATGSYFRKPIELRAPSPDPEGREIPIVRNVWQLDLLLAAGLWEKLEFGIALPIRLVQSGTGAGAATSRVGAPLRETAIVDPRVAASWGLFDRSFSGKVQLEVKIPAGDKDAFSGEPSLVWIPAFILGSKSLEGFHLGAYAGVRIRERTTFADVTVGSQVVLSAGVQYDLLPELGVGLEAWVLPSLVDQPETPLGQATFVPSEWMASVESKLDDAVTLFGGFGTALPLSTQTAVNASDESDLDYSAGLSSPAWRAILRVRYTQ